MPLWIPHTLSWFKFWEWPGRILKLIQQWHEMQEAKAKRRTAERIAEGPLSQEVRKHDLKPKIEVKFELEHRLDGDLVVAIVHNDEVGADIWAPVKFSGPIAHIPSRDVFALWMQTEDSKIRIPKGGECRLKIAKVCLDGFTGQWHFFYTSEGKGVEMAETYTHLFGRADVVAQEKFAELWIYTDPDTAIGTQGFKLTFGCPGEYSVTRLASS